MGKFNVALLALLSAMAAPADWTLVSSTSEFSSFKVVEHRHVVVRSDAGDDARLELAIFSGQSATLRVLDDPAASSSLAEVMPREHGIAGVNGGYFDPQYAPVGMLVSDGCVVTPLTKAKLLSGVVSVVNGRVTIQHSAQYSKATKPSAARQCGPFLVEGGKALATLNNTRAARRTFVATGAGDRVLIGFSSSVTLAEMGAILASAALAPEFKLQRALNLDGGSSSGFWFAGEKGVFSISEQKTVRDYLAIVPKVSRPEER